MNFKEELQAFLDGLAREGKTFPPSEMLRAYVRQLAACIAIASVKANEDPEPLLELIDLNVREKTQQCILIEKRRRN